MAEQKSGGTRGVRRRAGAAKEQARGGARKATEEGGSTVAKATKGAADAPGEVADQVQGSDERSGGGSDRGSGEAQTLREELGSIVRETAIEVLGPVMRSATKSAAKYAVRKAPEMAMGKMLPKLRELQSTVQDAGGPGAYARETLGSGSEGGGGLSRLTQLGRGDEDSGRGDEDSGKASERVPEQASVDVAAPLETVYEQFAQVDDFAELLSGGDIVEEQENERIVWTNEDEDATAVVTFHRLDDRLTRVMVSYDQPQNFAGKALSALHTRRRGLRSDMARFKALVEMNELGREDGDAPSDEDQDAPRGRRRASRQEESSQEEPENEEYGDEEPYDAEEEEEPEAESGDIVDAESEEIPDDEIEEPPEAESEPEPDEEPEPKPRRRPAPKRAPRRRAPAKTTKSPRARAKRS
ncbi:MAG TPA: hypothetical protein VGL78_11685 [Solirubrobacteraceae bacterium]